VADVLDIGGVSQQERGLRVVVGILTGEKELGAWLREDLVNDPRGYATASWALICQLGLNLAEVMTGAYGSRDAAVERLRSGFEDLYASAGDQET